MECELNLDGGENCKGDDGRYLKAEECSTSETLKKKDFQDIQEVKIQFDWSCVFLNNNKDQTSM